eukprot:jgi/Botrbrau1/9695/Bobra.0201s0025.1
MALPAEEWQALGSTIPTHHPGMQELLQRYPFLQADAMSKGPRSSYAREAAMRFCHISDAERVSQGFLPLPLEPPQVHARAVLQYWSSRREGRHNAASESPPASPQLPRTPSLQKPSQMPSSPASASSSSTEPARVSRSPQKLSPIVQEKGRVQRAVAAIAAKERSHTLRRAQAYLDQVLEKAAPTCIVPSGSSSDFLDFIVCPKTASLMEAS